jgi:hypothetical protein
MFNKKLAFVLAMLLALCVLFTSCSAADKNDYNSGADFSPSVPEIDNDYGYGDVKLPDSNNSASDNVVDQTLAQKIIRTVYMDAQTKEFDATVTAIRTALKESGGFEESFRTNNRTYGSTDYYSRSAHMVLRIPAEKLDAFLNEVGGMVHVTSQNSNVQNVTSEYYDIEARLKVLESERTVYERMLENAKTTSEMLSIQDRLYNVISEIEAFKTRLRVLDSQVSYSTVTMNLSEVVEYSKIQEADASFGDRIYEAFVTSWQNFADNAQDFAVWFIRAFPTLLVLASPGIVAWIIVGTLKAKRRKKKKKLEMAAETAQDKTNTDQEK